MTADVFCPPDLRSRSQEFIVERRMKASPRVLYKAWTQDFDRWFATEGTLLMKPETDAPFFFETVAEIDPGSGIQRHPHYGRFLTLEPYRRVEMTWMTGTPGTGGVETVVRVELSPEGDGARLRLIHTGFADEATGRGHQEGWEHGLSILDEKTGAG